MIEVKGPNVFKGYWRMPEKTAEEFRADGYFITGDLGPIDERGYVNIVGRAKDLIISGGFNVYPIEIEARSMRSTAFVESAVIGLPHPDFGEGVTAVVVPRAGRSVDGSGGARCALQAGCAATNCPNASSSSNCCRATRWARCRRRRCARRTRTFIASKPCSFPSPRPRTLTRRANANGSPTKAIATAVMIMRTEADLVTRPRVSAGRSRLGSPST